MDRPATNKQQVTLLFIRGFLLMHGYPPTVREIAAYFDIFYGAALERLRGLARKGMIERSGSPRAIRIIERAA